MIEIIPAIDIIDGKCVRLSQGDYDSKKVYNENPVEVAREFEGRGRFSPRSQPSGIGADCYAYLFNSRFWWWSKE